MVQLVSERIFPVKLFDPRGGHNRHKCNFDFFEKWADNMAYVLGFLYADGSIIDAISSRTQYIQFNSIDKDVLEKIRTAMGSEHPISSRSPRFIAHRNGFYKSRKSFGLRIGSRKIFRDLLHFGIIPNKSKIVRLPNVPSNYLNHFIRGYFDGDGCVYLEKAKGITKPAIVKRLSVIFTSGSPVFLQELSAVLNDLLGVGYKEPRYGNYAFQLRYYTKDAVSLFKFLYKSCTNGIYLKRKFDIFKDYFKLSPRVIDREVSSILKRLA